MIETENKAWGLTKVFHFPYPWPVTAPVSVSSGEVDGFIYSLVAEPNGTLSFTAERDVEKYYENSQKLQFTNDGPVVFSVRWQYGECDFFINGSKLKNINDEPEEVLTINVRPLEEEQPYSFQPSNFIYCEYWVNYRKQWFQELQEEKERRKKKQSKVLASKRPKTFQEQFNELMEETRHLQKSLRNENYSDTKVAESLRKLIFYKEPAKDSLSYNPLLFRLANIKSLALPIYAFPENEREKPKIHAKSLMQIGNFPYLYRVFPKQQIMDLQEWLNIPTFKVKTDPDLVSARQLLGIYANTHASHFDEESPVAIDMLKSTIDYGNSSLKEFLTHLGHVVSGLCARTLFEFEREKFEKEHRQS